jgi:hypothetical protein
MSTPVHHVLGYHLCQAVDGVVDDLVIRDYRPATPDCTENRSCTIGHNVPVEGLWE